MLGGEAEVRLSEAPDSTVGVDVLYIDAETAAAQTDETTLVAGVPVLIVEILSPSDRNGEIDEKIDKYRSVGVPLVWVVDPHDWTVVVYRLEGPPQLFGMGQEFSGKPLLPGLCLRVNQHFE